jgi:hypothetical protein
MIELTNYFETGELNLAWIMNDQISYVYDKDNELVIYGQGIAQRIATCDLLSDLDRKIILSWTKSLGDFMHQGPVIIRPGLVLSKALLDTQLNFSSMDYRQPFKAMAVEIPDEILGPHGPRALAFVYQPFPGELIVSLRSRIGDGRTTYNIHIGNDLSTIEERASHLEWADTLEEADFFHGICRISINACLLAATRQTKTEPLPDKIAKKRAKKDRRLQQLAARHCQEITFRDLIIYDRVKTGSGGEETGVIYGPQHRRGHWKKVPFGPQHSLRRLMWLNDYWTHRDIKFGTEQQTIVMK